MLKGKTALITGGSRGIGRAMVELFLEQGAVVYYISTKESPHKAELEAASAKGGSRVIWHRGDVADEGAITETVMAILKDSGGLDILVNNAGITRDGLSFRMSALDWDQVMKVNLYSAFYICKPVARTMVKARKGSIINVSSVVGIMGNAGQINYASSKAGLIGFSKTLAREVGTRGVRVNVLAPGYITTDMTEAISDEAKKGMTEKIPMLRPGSPREVAGAALYLASDYSAYVTGQILGVDGGMGM